MNMHNNKVQFAKIRDVKSPVRASLHDAGVDWFVPAYSEELAKEILEGSFDVIILNDKIMILPQGRIKIPSGIKVNIFDKNTYLQMTNKSGQSAKKGLDVLANTIDADYRGECNISLVNTSKQLIEILWGEKIVQTIQKEYIPSEFEEISLEEYDALPPTDRGEGGFGHSGI